MKSTQSDWIVQRLIENEGDVISVRQMFSSFKRETGSNANRESYNRFVRSAYSEYLTSQAANGEFDDGWTEEDVLKLASQKQKLQDKNRVVNKSSREIYRVYNFLDELVGSYEDLMSSVNLSKIKLKSAPRRQAKYGVLHISDWHLNELIAAYEGCTNEFDYTIASKRAKKFVTEAIAMFKFKGVTNVVVISTGDLINSNRRLSEKMVSISSLTCASLLATQLLSHIIVELGQHFNITFAGVVGNESRSQEQMTFDTTWKNITDNWDFLIYENIKHMFEKNKNFNFVDGHPREKLLSLGDFNIAINHGDKFSANNLDKTIQTYRGKYLAQGHPIHAVFFGHIHSSRIADTWARSGSLVGQNPYSSFNLNLDGRASQNIYIVNGQSFDGYKIDLQDSNEYIGYDISDNLKRYGIEESQPNTEVIIRRYTV